MLTAAKNSNRRSMILAVKHWSSAVDVVRTNWPCASRLSFVAETVYTFLNHAYIYHWPWQNKKCAQCTLYSVQHGSHQFVIDFVSCNVDLSLISLVPLVHSSVCYCTFRLKGDV